jgi:ribonucleoside-diphosphate reductase alpha chain
MTKADDLSIAHVDLIERVGRSIYNTDFEDEFARETWGDKTQGPGEDTVAHSWDRIATALVAVETEEDRIRYYQEFLSILAKFNTLGGRIMSNIGINHTTASIFNCYVLNSRIFKHYKKKGIDSMEAIMECLTEQALTLKSEGGYGTNSSFMRPKGAYIAGVRSETPGAVVMLEMWDKQSDIITRGNGERTDERAKKNIRKGAQMVVHEVWHPDIEEFVVAKQTPGRLTKFNMSVGMSDKFMRAVQQDKDWDLIFPDTEHKMYNELWSGDIEAWINAGLPVKVYKTVSAVKLYETIMKSTYNRAEPGILFLDRMNKLNNLKYCERISATNPCGEQPLPDGGICLLGSMNLVNYVNADRTDWDYDTLKKDIAIHVRMLDNVNSIGKAPLDIQNWNIINKRRIGQGILGYGSALMLLKTKYGSKKALKLTESLCKTWANAAYSASAMLAKEKGAFPLYDSRYLDSEFLKVLEPETIALIKKYGIRNSHILSIAPTGNTGIYANVVSGGLEPVFSPEMIRTLIISHAPEGLFAPSKIEVQWDNQDTTYSATDSTDWKWYFEGDEAMLRCEYNGVVYKIDRNRGITKEVKCIDWAVRKLIMEGKWDPKAEWATTATKLTPEEHIAPMSIFAKYIDSAMSKTINLPNNFKFADFKDLYMNAWKSGYIKGVTTYRSGTMGEVLKEDEAPTDEEEVLVRDEIKLPAQCTSETFTITAEQVTWYIHVASWPGTKKKPFAIFINTNHPFKPADCKNSMQALTDLLKAKKIRPSLIDKQLDKCKAASNVDKTSRLLSMCLRHGVSIPNIISALDTCKPIVGSLLFHIIKFLSSYVNNGIKAGMKCPTCAAEVIYTEGCKKCSSCQWSYC